MERKINKIYSPEGIDTIFVDGNHVTKILKKLKIGGVEVEIAYIEKKGHIKEFARAKYSNGAVIKDYKTFDGNSLEAKKQAAFFSENFRNRFYQ